MRLPFRTKPLLDICRNLTICRNYAKNVENILEKYKN